MAPAVLFSSVSEPETHQRKAHNILFKNKGKAPAARSIEQEWLAYLAEPTDMDVDPLTYWQVSRHLL